MANIKLRDGSGVETTYNGVTTITVPLADGTGTVVYGASPLFMPNEYDNQYWGKTALPYLESIGAVGAIENYPVRNTVSMFASVPEIPSGIELNYNMAPDMTANINAMFMGATDNNEDIILNNLRVNPNLQNIFSTFKPKHHSVAYILNQISEINGSAYFYNNEGSSSSGGSQFIFGNMIQNALVDELDLTVLQNKQVGITGYSGFNSWLANACTVEMFGIPVANNATLTSNNFSNNIGSMLAMLGTVKFATNNGTPYTASWKSQSIDFSAISLNGVGMLLDSWGTTGLGSYTNIYDSTLSEMQNNYNAVKSTSTKWYAKGSGTTTVTVNGTNYTIKLARGFSHYDHDSAVETINSLPDTSAYIATAGGTNTIKFHPANGYFTDAGPINDLTAEEIAVATAKGWTVTFSGWTN